MVFIGARDLEIRFIRGEAIIRLGGTPSPSQAQAIEDVTRAGFAGQLEKRVQSRRRDIEIAREGGRSVGGSTEGGQVIPRTISTPTSRRLFKKIQKVIQKDRKFIPVEIKAEGRKTEGAITRFSPEVLRRAKEAIKEQEVKDVIKSDKRIIDSLPIGNADILAQEEERLKDVAKVFSAFILK